MAQNHIDVLRNNLLVGIVCFSYVKADGTQREARGTLCESLIPAEKMPKSKRKMPAGIFTYFDVDRNEWRCFNRERLTSVD